MSLSNLGFYSDLLDRSQEVIKLTEETVELRKSFISASNFSSDLDILVEAVKDRPESEILALAQLEFQHSLLLAVSGHYRHSHISIRLFLELFLNAILFSAHEIECRLWIAGKKDTNWASIVSADTGVFSVQFTGVFLPGTEELCRQYRVMAEKLYRECSEFVHGNKKSFASKDQSISFQEERLSEWLDRVETAIAIVTFAFLVRYVGSFTTEQRARLEHVIKDRFGHVAFIRDLFSGDAA